MFSGFGKGIQKKTASTPLLVVAEDTLRSRSRIAPGWRLGLGRFGRSRVRGVARTADFGSD
jgi:hypothetical protein